jgi:hypothetical protein
MWIRKQADGSSSKCYKFFPIFTLFSFLSSRGLYSVYYRLFQGVAELHLALSLRLRRLFGITAFRKRACATSCTRRSTTALPLFALTRLQHCLYDYLSSDDTPRHWNIIFGFLLTYFLRYGFASALNGPWTPWFRLVVVTCNWKSNEYCQFESIKVTDGGINGTVSFVAVIWMKQIDGCILSVCTRIMFYKIWSLRHSSSSRKD